MNTATTDSSAHEPRVRELWEMVLIGYSLTAGVVWWMIHLVGGAMLVPAACDHHLSWMLNVLTVVTALGAVSAIITSEMVRRWPSPVAEANERNRVLGLTGVLINTIALALILVEGVPTLLVSPCR